MLKTRIKKHLEYYLSFIGIQMIGGLLILMNSQNRSVEIMLVLLMTTIYTSWSIIHQYIHHNLSTRVVFEYILMGGVGLSLFFFVLK